MFSAIVDMTLLILACGIGWWARGENDEAIARHRAETAAYGNKVRSWPKGPWDRY